MDEFLIPDAAESGGLLFFQRSPIDPTRPIDSFWVRVTDQNMSAAIPVYAAYAPDPAALFADMARQWEGWSGELAWESLEGELAIRCSRDHFGHIFIRVEMRFGHLPEGWSVVATIQSEAGQLEALARRAELFFGRAG